MDATAWPHDTKTGQRSRRLTYSKFAANVAPFRGKSDDIQNSCGRRAYTRGGTIDPPLDAACAQNKAPEGAFFIAKLRVRSKNPLQGNRFGTGIQETGS